jgi:hypothetical protein
VRGLAAQLPQQTHEVYSELKLGLFRKMAIPKNVSTFLCLFSMGLTGRRGRGAVCAAMAGGKIEGLRCFVVVQTRCAELIR